MKYECAPASLRGYTEHICKCIHYPPVHPQMFTEYLYPSGRTKSKLHLNMKITGKTFHHPWACHSGGLQNYFYTKGHHFGFRESHNSKICSLFLKGFLYFYSERCSPVYLYFLETMIQIMKHKDTNILYVVNLVGLWCVHQGYVTR